MKSDKRMTLAELRRAARELQLWGDAVYSSADGMEQKFVDESHAEGAALRALSRKLYAHARVDAAERKAKRDLFKSLLAQARARTQ